MPVQHNQPGSTDQSVICNFYHRTHRPRQVDRGRPHPAVERHCARARDARSLDRMDIEQERGITIKSRAVRVPWTFDGTEYTLGMIDTPATWTSLHEVSRALAACEGAVLLVDATRGIEAQTLSNLYMAIDHDLAIIPVSSTKSTCRPPSRYKHAEEIAGLIVAASRATCCASPAKPAKAWPTCRPDRHGRARPARRPEAPRPRADLRPAHDLPRHRHLHPYGGRRTA